MPESQPRFLIGLIGAGIQASRSPAMHELEARRQGLRYVYKLIDLEKLGLGVEALPELLRAAERMGFDGLNITHPCKQAVIPLLTELSEEACAIGAVNTLVLRHGRRVGYNTDCTGFAENFQRGLSGARVGHAVLLGAGGAGAAAGHAALGLGIEHLTIFDVETQNAEHLASTLETRFGKSRATAGDNLADAMGRADGLIHATPTGMENHPGLPLRIELLHSKHWVAEIVYFPLETELLRAAKRIGCRTLNGGGMAVFQAVEAFRLFTGIQPDAERMLRSFASMDVA
jgi:shikimate dehydrogenase